MLCIHKYHAMGISLSNFYVINVCYFFSKIFQLCLVYCNEQYINEAFKVT